MTDASTAIDTPETIDQPAPSPADKAKKTNGAKAPQAKKYDFTAAKIAKLRDKDQLSWANVAKGLDLGSPSAARRAYTTLVRPHTESVLERFPNGTGRGATGAQWAPVDLADAKTVKAVRDAIADKLIQVAPLTSAGKPRTFFVAKVTTLAKGEATITDAEGKSHTLALANITGIQ